MAVLCGMPTIQYSARSARLSARKLFTFSIRRGLVPRDSIVDGDYDRVMSAFCHVINPRRSLQKIWGGFLYGVYIPGK